MTVANHIAVQKKERNEIKPRKLRSMRRRITTQKIVVAVAVVVHSFIHQHYPDTSPIRGPIHKQGATPAGHTSSARGK